MKVDIIQGINFSNLQGIKNTQATGKNLSPAGSSEQIANVYPANYYVSFRANETEKSGALVGLEESLDKLYEENKGKSTKYMEIHWSDFELTPSRMINDAFIRRVNEELKANEPGPVDEEVFMKAVKAGLKGVSARTPIRLREKNVDYDLKAANLVNSLKEEGKIPENISFYQQNYEESIPIIKALTEEVEKSLPDEIPARFKRVIIQDFREMYNETIKKENSPKFTESLLNDLKVVLNEEPFIAFNDKMLKIEAKNNQNEYHSSVTAVSLALLKDLTQSKLSPFDNEKLYKFLEENNERTDFLLEKLHGYGLPMHNAIFKASGLDDRYRMLMVDPGFVANIDQLPDFTKNTELTGSETPFELRQKFSDYLGTETVNYVLHTNSPDDIIERGITVKTAASADSRGIIKDYINLPDEGYGQTMFGKVQDNLKGNKNEYIRVTPENARVHADDFYLPGMELTIVTAKVPKISLVKQQGMFANLIDPRRMTEEGKKLIFVPFSLPLENATVRTVRT